MISVEDISSSLGTGFSPTPSASIGDEGEPAWEAQVEKLIQNLAPTNSSHEETLRRILARPDYKECELTFEQVEALFVSAKEPRFTCALQKNGALCDAKLQRMDRCQHHIQMHLGIRPFLCTAHEQW